MNITREDLPDRQVALTIELGPEEMEPALQKAYRQLVGRVNIPGFRPGKAPRSIFERFVGREALVEQAVEGMIGTTLHEAIDQQGIEHTDISDVQIESTDPVTVRGAIDAPSRWSPSIPFRAGLSKASMSISLARTSPCRENGTAKFPTMSVRPDCPNDSDFPHASEEHGFSRVRKHVNDFLGKNGPDWNFTLLDPQVSG